MADDSTPVRPEVVVLLRAQVASRARASSSSLSDLRHGFGAAYVLAREACKFVRDRRRGTHVPLGDLERKHGKAHVAAAAREAAVFVDSLRALLAETAP